MEGAYGEGYKAYFDCLNTVDNPYEFGGDLWNQWLEGFFDAVRWLEEEHDRNNPPFWFLSVAML